MAPKGHQIDDKQETAAEQGVMAKVRWNTRSLKSIYANFCSESITRNCGCTRQDTEIELAHRDRAVVVHREAPFGPPDEGDRRARDPLRRAEALRVAR